MGIINFFDSLKYWRQKRNKFLSKIYYYQIVSTLVTIAANIVLPIYFELTKNRKKHSLDKEKKRQPRVIISLTSFPPRLPKLWLVIECLLRQTVKPDAVILYLTAGQVNSIEELPKRLREQQKRGLQIVLCPDKIRSHTKYYYAMSQNPDDIVITVDDDLFYRTDLVERHLKAHALHPNAIIANWVKEIKPSTPLYKEWPDGTEAKLSNRFLLLGVSSVLYPPHSLYKDTFLTKEIIELCLTADDVWLSCMALLQKTPIFFTNYEFNHIPISIANNETLLDVNRERNQVCVDNLNNYYKEKLGIQPFIDLHDE